MRTPLPLVLAAIFLAPCLATRAQNAPPKSSISLAIRARASMDPADARVVAQHAEAIANAAAFFGYTLDSSWTYEQAVCPLAPQSIVLNYTKRESGGGFGGGSGRESGAASGSPTAEFSSFTAVVPRQSGVVRIVPLVHGGTRPFVTPWGEHSYEVFNAVTASTGGLRSKGLDLNSGAAFVWGLCYVALVGEESVVSRPDRELPVFSATEPTIRVGVEGDVSLYFTVRDDSVDYSMWQLNFSPKGLLVHAQREQHSLRAIGMQTAESNGATPGSTAGAPSAPASTPARAQRRNSEEHPVPTGPEPVGKPIPDSDPPVTHPHPQN